jgi:hypothetical protein
MNTGIQTITTRAESLGYAGTVSEVMEQLKNEYSNFQNEKEKTAFAQKIAGNFHVSNFIELMN